MAVIASLATLSIAQSGYTETYYQDNRTPHHEEFGDPYIATGSTRVWTVTFGNFFTVTGDEDDTPPWRLLFAHLADNEWQTTQTLGEDQPPGYIIRNVVDYYHEEGSQGLTPNLCGGGQKTRNLNSTIVNYLTYDYEMPPPF